jgi:hypothetical protein
MEYFLIRTSDAYLHANGLLNGLLAREHIESLVVSD